MANYNLYPKNDIVSFLGMIYYMACLHGQYRFHTTRLNYIRFEGNFLSAFLQTPCGRCESA